jgi:TPR repeat protein
MTWEHGWGSIKNEPEAVYWYRKAAEQGYPAAEYDLGRMLADGRGVPGVDAEKNGAEADAWFRRAAEKGIREAQQRLETSGALTAPSK